MGDWLLPGLPPLRSVQLFFTPRYCCCGGTGHILQLGYFTGSRDGPLYFSPQYGAGSYLACIRGTRLPLSELLYPRYRTLRSNAPGGIFWTALRTPWRGRQFGVDGRLGRTLRPDRT